MVPAFESQLCPQLQLPAKAPWMAADEGSSTWVPATHEGDWDGVPDSQCHAGPGLTTVGPMSVLLYV